jgi:hypothetical protein
MNARTKILATAVLAVGLSSLSGSAGALPLAASKSLSSATTPLVETVQWWWGGWGSRGAGLGFVAGAVIGGAIAASSTYYYGYGYRYPAYTTTGYAYPGDYYVYPSYYGYASYGYGPGYYAYAYGYPRYYRWRY